MNRPVLLRGSGVAIAASARLLQRAGIGYALEPAPRRAVPVVMLGDTALGLLREVLGEPALFAGSPTVRRRIVRWGDAPVVDLPHSAVVVSGQALAEACSVEPREASSPPVLTLHAALPIPSGFQHFGTRPASTGRVVLEESAPAHSCWAESTPGGWLFLTPTGDGMACLMAAGEAPAIQLRQAQLIPSVIAAFEPWDNRFETAPGMLAAVAGWDWLACGTSAMRFDPLCGDGTAQSVREAILACAVTEALHRGEGREAVFTHYHSMMLAAMRRHLQLTLPFYARGGHSGWWREQQDSIRAGHEWCTRQLSAQPEPRYQLRGFELMSRPVRAA